MGATSGDIFCLLMFKRRISPGQLEQMYDPDWLVACAIINRMRYGHSERHRLRIIFDWL
jgi:hypothetical protein